MGMSPSHGDSPTSSLKMFQKPIADSRPKTDAQVPSRPTPTQEDSNQTRTGTGPGRSQTRIDGTESDQAPHRNGDRMADGETDGHMRAPP